MAGGRLELLIVLSRAGGFALSMAAVAVLAVAVPRFTANNLVLDALIYGVIPCDMSLLLLEGRWLCLGGQRPGNAYLYILVAWEWTVACFSVGTACAAINANLFALQHHYCDEGRPACVLYLVASAMAFAAGSLAAVSALGIVWIHGSRFRPVQAP